MDKGKRGFERQVEVVVVAVAVVVGGVGYGGRRAIKASGVT